MKLDHKRTLYVGLAFFSICAFWQVYDSIIPLILKESFHISDTLSGAIMALDNILALFLLPFFGALSDKTHTRLGRRMPYIIIGTLSAAVFMNLIPLTAQWGTIAWFMVALCLVLCSMSVYRSPAVALMPDVTPKPLRSRGNAIINLMGAVGGILSLGLIAVLVPKTEHPSYTLLILCVSIIMVLSLLVMLRKVNEPQLVAQMRRESGEEVPEGPASVPVSAPLPKDVKRSLILILLSVALWYMGYNAVTTAFSKYARFYWGLEGGLFAYTLIIAQIAAILSYIPAGLLASKFGRKKTILLGVAFLALAFGAAFLFKTFSALIFVFFALAGVGWATINVNSYPMVVEMSQGADVGKYTGYYYTFSMAAQVITPMLSGFFLEHVGYGTLFPYATLFVVLSFVTMCFVKHGDNRPDAPQSKLEAFEAMED